MSEQLRALGVSRYYLSAAIQHRVGSTFPWGTLVINVTGSLALGFLMRYALSTRFRTD
jgi:fluoride ion exporter CrcB/FEX